MSVKKIIIGCCFVSAVVSAAVATMFAHVPIVGGLPDFSTLIEEDGPGVVNIRTVQKVVPISTGNPTEMQDLLHSFFAPPLHPKRVDPTRGIGSGFFISKDGYLLTNAHVVAGATEVIITLADRREYLAQILGTDERTDVALLKVNAEEDLPYLRVGKSTNKKVGEWVFAIGSPFNLENTATAGIISAISRDAGEYLPLIQSDVSINPGNSGGPLIDVHGDVIGINSQILQNPGGGVSGISFAVPIDEAMRIAEQLKHKGKVTRGRLGVHIAESGITIFLGNAGTRAVSVQFVEAGGPAAKAGMLVGDTIFKFDGETVNGASDLPWRVGRAGNKSVDLIVLRNSEEVHLTVKLDTLDENRIDQSEDIIVSQ